MVSDDGENSDCFQDHSTPENWEIESKEDYLTVIELSETDSFSHKWN